MQRDGERTVLGGSFRGVSGGGASGHRQSAEEGKEQLRSEPSTSCLRVFVRVKQHGRGCRGQVRARTLVPGPR